MVTRARRVVNQSNRVPSVCADGLIRGYARRPWMLAAAQRLSLRRDFQTVNGGKVRGISHTADSDPMHTAYSTHRDRSFRLIVTA